MSLVTTCPSCGTVFRMVREQLDASGGWVRCGHCMDVFDAKAQLTEATDMPTQADVAVGSFLPSSELSFVQSAQKKAFWQARPIRWMLLIGALLLLAILLLQMLRFEQERITTALPRLSPALQRLCSVLTCPQPARRQIDAWLIEHASFQKEPMPSAELAFRLGFQLKNTASTRLWVPHAELSLLDSNDALLVRSSVRTGDEAFSMAAGEERSFSYVVKSAVLADRITGYRLVLFYP